MYWLGYHFRIFRRLVSRNLFLLKLNMNILDLEFFVEVQYDIFKILSPNNIHRSLPSYSILTEICF